MTSSDLALNFELDATLLLLSEIQISISGNILSWPAEAGWFPLYSTTNLTPPVAWTLAPGTASQSNGAWYFPLPITTNAQTFYRLQGP